MPRNVYFSHGSNAEQILFEDIQIEALKIYGHETYYLPRKILTRDMILNEDRESLFDDAYMIEMYIEDIEGFGGEGNLMSKFGLEIRDEATFVVARRSWNKLVGVWNNTVDNFRPNEGDLIYLPLSNSMFEISFVEHEQPFYQIQNLPVYKLQCRLFEYNDEDFRTGMLEIDQLETVHADVLSMLVRSITGNIELNKRYYQYFPTTGYTTSVARKAALPGLITAKDTEITNLQTSISAKQAQISSTQTNISALQTQISSVGASITTTQSQLATAQTQLSQLQPTDPMYSYWLSQISTLQSQLASLQSQLSTLNSNLSTEQVNLTTYNTDLITLNTTLASAESQKAILEAELVAVDTLIRDAFDAMPFVSGMLVEQDQVGGTSTNRTFYIADIETNTTDVKEFYVSTQSNVNTYITTAKTLDGYQARAIVAEIYEIYDLSDNVNRTFENDDAAQNFDFEKAAENIIDFTEKNPFGEPN